MGEPFLNMVCPATSSHGRIVLSKGRDRPGFDFGYWLRKEPRLGGGREIESPEENFELVHPSRNLKSGKAGGHVSQSLASFVPLPLTTARVAATKVLERHDDMEQALQMPPPFAFGFAPEIFEGLVGLEPLPAPDEVESVCHHTADCTGFVTAGRARWQGVLSGGGFFVATQLYLRCKYAPRHSVLKRDGDNSTSRSTTEVAPFL